MGTGPLGATGLPALLLVKQDGRIGIEHVLTQLQLMVEMIVQLMTMLKRYRTVL